MNNNIRILNNKMYFHPGYYINEYIKNNTTRKCFSKRLGVSIYFLNKIINGEINIGYKLSKRLSKVTNTSIELWLNLQESYLDSFKG